LTRTPLAYPVAITRTTDNMPMRLIPAGTFLMGSKEEDFLASSDEIPQREVTLSQFYMDQYEVSVAQYSGFLNRLGRYREACNFHDCALPRLVVGYTSYLDEIDAGRHENVPAPQIAIDYWKLQPDAHLRDVVIAIRDDEAGHRNVNHDFANALSESAA